jgi:hypothetical protein
MKSLIIFGGIAAAAIATAPLGNAVVAEPGNPDLLVMQLQSEGHTVIVNRIGSLPLSECSISAVRPGQTYSRFDSGYPGAGSDPMTQVTSMTVYVDATC